MADYALFAIASEKALGLEPGELGETQFSALTYYFVRILRFPQGDLVGCIGNTEPSIRFWDSQTGECWRTICLEAEAFIFGLDFHPQGHYFVTAGHDDRLCWWDVQTGECLSMFRPDRLYEGTNIAGITGLTQGEIATLKSLGAIETDRCSQIDAGHNITHK
jgi:hypothetical protein